MISLGYARSKALPPSCADPAQPLSVLSLIAMKLLDNTATLAICSTPEHACQNRALKDLSKNLLS
jgi:hypothetical protein